MNNRSIIKDIIKLVAAIIIFIILAYCIECFKPSVTLSTGKSIDMDNPITISAGEEIHVKASVGKYSSSEMYVYWNEEPDTKIRLSIKTLTNEGTIVAPSEPGEYTLILQKSNLNSTKYYFVIEKK